jgi:hypothetical protein
MLVFPDISSTRSAKGADMNRHYQTARRTYAMCHKCFTHAAGKQSDVQTPKTHSSVIDVDSRNEQYTDSQYAVLNRLGCWGSSQASTQHMLMH